MDLSAGMCRAQRAALCPMWPIFTQMGAIMFDELVLVAPSHALSELTDALDTTTRAKLIATLAKDFVKTPDHELWPHLKEWVRPVHRAGVPPT